MINTNEIIEYSGDFLNNYKNTRAVYTEKELMTLEMCQLIEQQGLCLGVLSGRDLATAMEAGFPSDKIEFNGNSKSVQDIEMAIDYGVGRIIIDGADELELVESVCRERRKKINALLRIRPETGMPGQDGFTTGTKILKFGISLDPDIFSSVFRLALSSQYVNLLGFHFHVSSRFHDHESTLKTASFLLHLVLDLKRTYGFNTAELNIGEFAIHHSKESRATVLPFSLEPVMKIFSEGFDRVGFPRPAIVMG